MKMTTKYKPVIYLICLVGTELEMHAAAVRTAAAPRQAMCRPIPGGQGGTQKKDGYGLEPERAIACTECALKFP